MNLKEMHQKVKSIKLYLMAHPHNTPNSEFGNRIDDLQEIEETLYKATKKVNVNAKNRPKYKSALKMFDQGITQKNIAIKLGVTDKTVGTWVKYKKARRFIL